MAGLASVVSFLAMIPHDHILQPSAWIARWAGLIPRGSRVLDLACGTGRNTRMLASHGLQVEAVDRDPDALAMLVGLQGIATRRADLEADEWPYPSERFDAIVVCSYLHRPLFPTLLEALAPDGLLIYETFARGNERYGRPGNPDFLLRPGELLEVARGRLAVVAFEEGFVAEPRPAVVQRICAARPGPSQRAAD